VVKESGETRNVARASAAFVTISWTMAGLPAGCIEDDQRFVVRTCTDPEIVDRYAATRPDLPLVRQTPHLDIHAEPGWFVCAGMAAELERHVVFVAQALGIQDLRAHIPFYYTLDLPEPCSPTAIGCTMQDGAAYGLPTTAYHELTHAVACQLRINGTQTYTEGLAKMFEQAERGHQAHADDFDGELGDLLIAAPTNYSYAGHLVRYLIEREGGPAFAAVYAGSRGYPPPVELEAISSVLEQTYDVELATLAADYAADAPHAWAPLRQCADIRHVDAQHGEWHMSGTMDCEDEATMGPYARPHGLSATHALAYMYHSVTFDVATPGLFFVEIAGADHVQFARCAERHAQTPEEASMLFRRAVAYAIPELPTETIELTPGRWRADILRAHALPGPYAVVIRPAP
jgi:hypothetical protein